MSKQLHEIQKGCLELSEKVCIHLKMNFPLMSLSFLWTLRSLPIPPRYLEANCKYKKNIVSFLVILL